MGLQLHSCSHPSPNPSLQTAPALTWLMTVPSMKLPQPERPGGHPCLDTPPMLHIHSATTVKSIPEVTLTSARALQAAATASFQVPSSLSGDTAVSSLLISL